MAVSNARIEQRPDEAPRRVTILGSTGSVGCNTIDLIDRQPGAFQVEALTVYDNVELLAEQAGGNHGKADHRQPEREAEHERQGA